MQDCCEHSYCNTSCYPKPPPIPVVFKELKTIALLELTGIGTIIYDNSVKKTFEYYFTNNSKEFKTFPIVDTEGSVKKTLYFLDLYYNLGYRIFIGFNRSSMLNSVLSWFLQHPDATGMSLNSTSPTLSIPKNVYRLTPSDDNILASVEVSPFLLSRNNIFYVYSQGEVATEYVLSALLSPLSPIKDKIVPIPILPDGSNMSDVQTQYTNKGATALTDSTIIYLFVENQRRQFIDLFTPSFTPIPTFNISINIFPEFIGIQKTIWNQLFYAYQNINVSTSPLWRKGYETLGSQVYNSVSLNALQLNNYLKRKFDLNDMPNYAYMQEFNQNKDIIYFSYSDFVWKNETWIPDAVFIKDPIFGVIYKTLND